MVVCVFVECVVCQVGCLDDCLGVKKENDEYDENEKNDDNHDNDNENDKNDQNKDNHNKKKDHQKSKTTSGRGRQEDVSAWVCPTAVTQVPARTSVLPGLTAGEEHRCKFQVVSTNLGGADSVFRIFSLYLA